MFDWETQLDKLVLSESSIKFEESREDFDEGKSSKEYEDDSIVSGCFRSPSIR